MSLNNHGETDQGYNVGLKLPRVSAGLRLNTQKQPTLKGTTADRIWAMQDVDREIAARLRRE